MPHNALSPNLDLFPKLISPVAPSFLNTCSCLKKKKNVTNLKVSIWCLLPEILEAPAPHLVVETQWER